MKTSLYQIKDLIGAEYNPRKISEKQLQDLTDSIRRFGFVEPVIVNVNPERKNIIISGHQRVRVATAIGETEVPCVEVDLTVERERELNIRMNKAGGEFDLNLLHDNFSLGDLISWGFEEKELNFVVDPEEKDDDVPEPPAEAVTKPGDIITLGSHRVMCGDATKREDVALLMGGRVANMVHTDPPYNVDYGVSKNPPHKIRTIENDKQSPEEWHDFCNDVFLMFKEFNLGDIYMWGASGPEGMKMRLWLTEMGCHWSATIIWKKQQLVLSPAKYQRMYEPCFYGWFGQSTFGADRKQTEVWEINRPLNSKLHPTMKPVELCQLAIQNSSKWNDVVLDLFLGSGSTLIACEKTNRICYGMEISPVYCDVIVKRWEDHTGKKAVRPNAELRTTD